LSDLPPIINFAAVDFWYHNRSHSEIQITTRLSLSTRVLFINSIGMRAPIPGRSSNSGFRIWRKIKSLFKGLRKPLDEYPNFYVFTPVLIPAYSTPAIRKINYKLIYLQVKIVAAFLKIKRPIIFETIPTANEIAPRLKPILEVVNRVDKMSAFSETDSKYIETLEKSQISRAQRTYYTSQLLLKDEANWHNGKGIFLDHGIDLDLFKPKSSSATIPDELADITTPIIGFFGGIDDYVIDIELLEQLADEFSDCTLVLIGQATCDISSLTSKPNVIYFGMSTLAFVARIGAFFDVAILPRKNDEWTKYTNPIKIKEYLGLGLEIVSMEIPEIQKYSKDIRIANDRDSFISQTKLALQSKSSINRRNELHKLVAQDSWDNRVKDILSDLEGLL